MKVTRKQVYRWSIGGKTFHNETAAYRYLAKQELGYEMLKDVSEILLSVGIGPMDLKTQEQRKMAVTQAYAKRFPHAEGFSCEKYSPSGGQCGFTSQYPTGHYPWCKTAWKKWIDAKIQELREVDKNETTI